MRLIGVVPILLTNLDISIILGNLDNFENF